MDLQPLGTGRLLGSGPALGLAERPTAVPRPRGAQRPVPDCSSDFAHLTLSGLRAYRSVLAREEGQVSYWRRILQARLDVVREGRLGTVDSSHLRPVLTDERVGSGRSALVELLPVDDIPPLPSLGELWDRAVDPADRAGTERLETASSRRCACPRCRRVRPDAPPADPPVADRSCSQERMPSCRSSPSRSCCRSGCWGCCW